MAAMNVADFIDDNAKRNATRTAIAFRDLVPLKHGREAANFTVQLLVSQRAFLTRLAFPQDRGLVPRRPVQMPIEAILRNV